MSKTADEAWYEFRDAALALEVAKDPFLRATNLARAAREAVQAELANSTSEVGEPDPPAPSEGERKYPCRKCGKLRTKAEGGTTFTVCESCWDHKEIPSEGSEGEVDEDMPPVVRYLLGSGPFDGLWYGEDPPQGVGRYWWRRALRETVQRLQRERDRSATDSRRMQQLWTEALDAIRERDAEIAHLRDPENWDIVGPPDAVFSLDSNLKVMYVGPDSPPDTQEDDDGTE